MLTVLSAIVAVCAIPFGIGLPVINIQLDSLNGPTDQPILNGNPHVVSN